MEHSNSIVVKILIDFFYYWNQRKSFADKICISFLQQYKTLFTAFSSKIDVDRFSYKTPVIGLKQQLSSLTKRILPSSLLSYDVLWPGSTIPKYNSFKTFVKRREKILICKKDILFYILKFTHFRLYNISLNLKIFSYFLVHVLHSKLYVLCKIFESYV